MSIDYVDPTAIEWECIPWQFSAKARQDFRAELGLSDGFTVEEVAHGSGDYRFCRECSFPAESGNFRCPSCPRRDQ